MGKNWLGRLGILEGKSKIGGKVLVEEGVVVRNIHGCPKRVSHIHLQLSFYL